MEDPVPFQLQIEVCQCCSNKSKSSKRSNIHLHMSDCYTSSVLVCLVMQTAAGSKHPKQVICLLYYFSGQNLDYVFLNSTQSLIHKHIIITCSMSFRSLHNTTIESNLFTVAYSILPINFNNTA